MRPILRPGLRLLRDGAGRAALVDGYDLSPVDPLTAELLDPLDGLLEDTAVLARVGGAAQGDPTQGEPTRGDPAQHDPALVADTWRRLVRHGTVVDGQLTARLAGELDEPARQQAGAEAAALVAAAHADAARRWRRRRDAVVELQGWGATTVALAVQLARAGVGAFAYDDARREVLDEALTDAVGHSTRLLRTAGRPPEIALLTADHEPATDRVEELMRTGTAHLVVGMRGAHGVVGPLVRPGAGACLRCLDLVRRERDPAWGWAREQLSTPGRSAPSRPAPAALVAMLTGLAAAETLAQVEGRDPQTLGTTAALSPHRPVPELWHWPTHVECGCMWDTTFADR